MDFSVKQIKAREILNSGGNPTVEVELKNGSGIFLASTPSGVSTGKYEAVELRDADGKGVKEAIKNIEKIIAPALEKEDLNDQKRIDEILIKLDGTKNKSRLGANAILPVSMAVCRAGAAANNVPLHRYISEIAGMTIKEMPKPSFNMIEGGRHTSLMVSGQASPAFQEFMAVPKGQSFKENLETGKEVYEKLKEILKKKFKEIKLSTEGAFTAPLSVEKSLDFLCQAGGSNIEIALDAAASSFYNNGLYKLGNKNISREKLSELYQYIILHYPVISVEDPFFEEDFGQTLALTDRFSVIFGDDLLASNVERMKMAKEKNACNGLILKPNQIGTISETIAAAKLAKSYGWKIMVSNRAGETKDSFIADLAAGIGADFIKSGAPFPEERMAKYDRLVKIEEELAVLKTVK
ncbi:MAG: phosphopyruvate hydratase [Parcubacteria group bacterium]